jgi:hypothetical protein
VHSRAIRTVMKRGVDENECVRFFSQHVGLLHRAAQRKIDRKCYPANFSFHLTSRDVRREFAPQHGKT